MNKIIKNIFGNKFKHVEAQKIKKIRVNIRNLTNESIKYILKKPHEEKTNEDIAVLKNFCLLKSKFIDKLIHDHIEEAMQEIIIILSMLNASYINIKNRKEVIYNIDDNAEYFYIILEGEVSIWDSEKIDTEMNGEKYFRLLLDYKRNNDNYLLRKTLEDNRINFPIDINDIDILDKILLKIYLLSKNNIKSLKDNPYFIEIIFQKLDLKFSDFGIVSYQEILDKKNELILEENEKNKKEGKIEEEKELIIFDIKEAYEICNKNEKIILEQIKDIVPNSLCNKYYFLITTPELPISYYRYREYKTLHTLDYFGENETKVYSYRVVANQDNVELLYFKNDIYNEFVTHMKSKFVGTQVDFLLDNFFFNSIYKVLFDRVYLKYFEYDKFIMNQTIIEENEPIKFLYFVKSGNIKLFSKRNIIQNHILIQIINRILQKKSLLIRHGKSIDDNNNESFNLYSKIKGNFEYIQNEIKIKKNMHLMSYQEKQCIGFECFYFGFNSLYTALASSEKVEVYKISIDKLVKILTIKNKKALYDFSKQAEKALKVLLDRIIKINNMLLFKYSQENRELANEISYLMEKAINLIQKENIIRKSRYMNPKTTQLKKVEQISSNKDNSELSRIKGKSHSIEFNNINEHAQKKLKNSIKIKKIDLDKIDDEEKRQSQMNKYDLTARLKIFDYKANLIKEKNKEIERETNGLGLISNIENKKIKILKKQNEICNNFFKLSQGDRRIFIKNRYNSAERPFLEKDLETKTKSALFNKNKIKIKKIFSIERGRNNFKELYPYNNRFNGYKPYKYNLTKTMLVNKKLFEYSIFKRPKKILNHCKSNSIVNHRYKNNINETDKNDSKKKKISVINCQDLYIY